MIKKEITFTPSTSLENQGKESEKQMAFYLNHSMNLSYLKEGVSSSSGAL